MEFSLVVTAILSFATFYIFYRFITNKLNYWEKVGVPYVVSSPLVAIKDALMPKKPMAAVINDGYLEHEGQKYYGGYSFFTPALILRDLDLINHILVKDFTYFEDRETPATEKELFSKSLFSLSGHTWRHARYKLTPTFTSGKLRRMFSLIKECSDEVVGYLKEKKPDDLLIKELTSKFVFNVIGKVAFGLNIDALNEKKEKDNEFLEKGLSIFQPSIMQVIKQILVKLAPSYFNFKIFDSEIENFFRNLTKDLIRYRETSDEKRNDFLQIMLDEKKKEGDNSRKDLKYDSLTGNEVTEPEDQELLDQLKNMPITTRFSSSLPDEIFTDEFIAAQAFTFLTGGSESTASALMFVLYELAINRHVQIKLQNEISDILSTQEFSYQAVSKMTYLEQCINETFRLHPFIPVLVRMCTRDYKLPGEELVLKKNMLVFIPVIGLHNDPQHFKEPEIFDPDRFMDMKSIPKGAFLPFGGGPRFCIAMRLAMLEIKVFLATLLSSFTVHISKKTKLPLKLKKYSFFSEVDGGIWVILKNRETQ